MKSSKNDAQSLNNIPVHLLERERLPKELSTCRYSYKIGSLQFDYLYKPTDVAKLRSRLVVFFSGAIDRERHHPPVFQRWTWASRFDANVVYLSDPGLHLSDKLKIGWYFGTAQENAISEYSILISELSKRLEIEQKNIILYGSSAGGFAALQALRYLPNCAAIAINPQTRLSEYRRSLYEAFLKICIGDEVSESMRSRLDLLTNVSDFRSSRIILAQNTFDKFHLDNHFTPFVESLRREDSAKYLQTLMFENEGGHGAAEPLELVPKLLSLLG